jgi:hypothetical protein
MVQLGRGGRSWWNLEELCKHNEYSANFRRKGDLSSKEKDLKTDYVESLTAGQTSE